MAYVGTLAINVVANTGQFRSGLRGASRDVSVFTGTVNKSMRALTPFSSMFGMGVGLGATAGLVSMGKAANDFAGEMNRSLAIMTDVGPKMRREMELTAHSVAYNTQYSAKQAAQAYFYLASAGMDAKASLAALPAVSRFAQAGNFDLATATDLATDAQSALGLKSADATENLKNLTRVTDVLVKANTTANASVQQFSESITNKAGVASRMYGISLEETTAVLAAFADQGIKAAEAGTKYSIVLRDLTTKAITNKAAFEKLGLATFEYGEFRRWADIIGDLESLFRGLNDEKRKAALLGAGFTDKSVAGLQALIGKSDDIRRFYEEYKKAGGTTKDVSDKVLTDFDKAWNKVTASMTVASTSGFAPVLEHLADLIESTDRFTSRVGRMNASMDKWVTRGQSVVQVWKALVWTQKLMPLHDIAHPFSKFFPESDSKGVVQSAVASMAAQSRARRAAALNADRMDLPGPSGEWKAEQQALKDTAEENEQRWKKEADALLKDRMNVGRFGKAQYEDSRMRWAMQEGAKAGDAWVQQQRDGKHIIEQMRTPLERYKAQLTDINKLLKAGAIDAITAGRAGLAARADYRQATEPAQPDTGPTFSPAMLRGSLEAYQATIRAASPDRMRDPADETAEATKKSAVELARLVRLGQGIVRKQTKPGTVETAP
jgi:TP901 family phage tail tape measure protein